MPEDPLREYEQSLVLAATQRAVLAAILYFVVVGSYVVWQCAPAFRPLLVTQKLVYIGALVGLWNALRRGRFPAPRADLAPSLVLLACVTSPLFSVACGITDNLGAFTVILMTAVGLTFLRLPPATAWWIVLWIFWAALTSHSVRDLVMLLGFQLLATTTLLARRADCWSRFELRQSDIRKTRALEQALQEANLTRQQLDLLVDERTRALRLAYEELQLSLQQRQEMQFASEKLQQQLLQAQKMESLGRLAGGVAHDFNNLLTVILGNLELARLDAVDPEQRELLEQAELASRRAGEVSSQLLAFSRRQVLSFQNLDLSGALATSVRLVERLLGEDIELVLDVNRSGLIVRGDASQLQQVVMNLVVNARDAMPDGGRLTISLLPVERHGQPWAVLSVQDTGTGIEASALPQVLEPFFTTKPVDRARAWACQPSMVS